MRVGVFLAIFILWLFNASPVFAQKIVEIDLAHQKLYAYEDNKLIYDFLISSG